MQLETVHQVAETPADAIKQWFNAGGMLQFYDYPLDDYINVTGSPLYLLGDMSNFSLDYQGIDCEQFCEAINPSIARSYDSQCEVGSRLVRKSVPPREY